MFPGLPCHSSSVYCTERTKKTGEGGLGTRLSVTYCSAMLSGTALCWCAWFIADTSWSITDTLQLFRPEVQFLFAFCRSQWAYRCNSVSPTGHPLTPSLCPQHGLLCCRRLCVSVEPRKVTYLDAFHDCYLLIKVLLHWPITQYRHNFFISPSEGFVLVLSDWSK